MKRCPVCHGDLEQAVDEDRKREIEVCTICFQEWTLSEGEDDKEVQEGASDKNGGV